MKEQLEAILRIYDEKEAEIDQFDGQLHAEKSRLRNVLNQLIWNDLTYEERQSKRRSILAILEVGTEENENFKYSGYEGALIAYYDLLLRLKGELDNLENDLFIQERLRALIYIEMREIDKNSRMFNINLTKIHILKGLIDEAMNTLNLPVLNRIVEIRKKLEVLKPYKS